MPNIEVLQPVDGVVRSGFLQPGPDGPNAHKKLLAPLRRLHLSGVQVEDGDQLPLVHQTSGGHAVSLGLFGRKGSH